MTAGHGGSSLAGSEGWKLPQIGHPSETNHYKHRSVWQSLPTMAQHDGAPWCWAPLVMAGTRNWRTTTTHQSVSLDPPPNNPLYLTRLPVARFRSKWLSREETKTTTTKTREITPPASTWPMSMVSAKATARNVTLNAQLGRPHQLEGVVPAAVWNHQPDNITEPATTRMNHLNWLSLSDAFLVHHFCSVDRPLPLPCQGAARPTQHSELPLRLLSTSADFTWRIDPAEFTTMHNVLEKRHVGKNAQRQLGLRVKQKATCFCCRLPGPFAKTPQYSRKKKWSQSKRLRKSDDPPVLLCPPLHS